MTVPVAAPPASNEPTVVLIGGPMTLEHDEQLDSRQRVEGDPASLTAHKTMAGSLLWWMTTASLVDGVLDSAGPEAFALIIGSRTVVELRGDGTLRTLRLRSFLRGGVGSVKTVQTTLDTPLEERYEYVQTLRSEGGVPIGRAGVDVGPPGTRWRFLEGGGPLVLLIRAIAPTVIVDAAPRSIFGLFARYEATRLVDGTTLVLPHTQATEWYMRGLFDWVRRGRPHENPFGHGPWTQAGQPIWKLAGEAESPTTVAVPASAQFGVTGLFRDGRWCDPNNLEAARAFVQSRYDLRIGIWDLERSQALRANLLAPTSVSEPPAERASMPTGSARRTALEAAQRAAAKLADDRSRREAHVAAREELELLSPLGWKVDVLRPDAQEAFLREYFRLWLTQPVRRDGRAEPLAWLRFELNPRTSCVRCEAPSYYDPESNTEIRSGIIPYVASKRSVLERIATPGEFELGKVYPALWRVAGGWRDDDVDWPERVRGLHTRTPLWLEAFADLPQKLFDTWVQHPALKDPELAARFHRRLGSLRP